MLDALYPNLPLLNQMLRSCDVRLAYVPCPYACSSVVAPRTSRLHICRCGAGLIMACSILVQRLNQDLTIPNIASDLSMPSLQYEACMAQHR